MAEKEKITSEDDSEEMYVTLNTDEGDIKCSVLSILEVEGRDYIALMPLDENGESDGQYWIYRYSENPDDPNEEPVLEDITDDDEFERVDDAFDEFLDSVEFDELIDSEDSE